MREMGMKAIVALVWIVFALPAFAAPFAVA